MANIESVSNEKRVFYPADSFVAQANLSKADIDQMNASAQADYAGFWAKWAHDTLLWHKPFSKTLDESNAPFYRWFDGRTTQRLV